MYINKLTTDLIVSSFHCFNSDFQIHMIFSVLSLSGLCWDSELCCAYLMLCSTHQYGLVIFFEGFCSLLRSKDFLFKTFSL